MKKLTQYALIVCTLHLAAPTALYADAAACSKTPAAVSDSSPDNEAEQPATLTACIKEYWKVCVGVVAACAAVYYFTRPTKKQNNKKQNSRGGGGIKFGAPKEDDSLKFCCVLCEKSFVWHEQLRIPQDFIESRIAIGQRVYTCTPCFNNPDLQKRFGKKSIEKKHIFHYFTAADLASLPKEQPPIKRRPHGNTPGASSSVPTTPSKKSPENPSACSIL